MLLHEKADQAQRLLQEVGLDCWLIFSRETGIHPDTGMELVVGTEVVRNSAFLFGIGGERIAITARFDTANVRATGVFQEVIGYDEDIRPDLIRCLDRLNPGQIGLNYSPDDVTADGLTHGQWLLLNELLRGTPHVGRLTSAAPLLSRLRGRKSPAEIANIKQAVDLTLEIVDRFAQQIRPGISERQLADYCHDQFARRGLNPAWLLESCPIVNSGPSSEPGHGKPSAEIQVAPGHLVHIDLGVKHEGYCSDLQRMWYVRRPGETEAPEPVRRAFATMVRAIEAGANVLKPGAIGRDVDAAARRVVIEAGYPEYKHGLGHSLGQAVHDGGTHLGPEWPCYGKNCLGKVEKGNVFTLELGVATEAGYIGLEEDVVVTERGCEFISPFQRTLTLI